MRRLGLLVAVVATATGCGGPEKVPPPILSREALGGNKYDGAPKP